MKASKQFQKQFADFKAEFVHLCLAFGGERNPRAEHTGGENSAFTIRTAWGTVRASIGLPWSSIDGTVYSDHRKRSSAEIYFSASDYQELPAYWGATFLGSTRKHWKWNIYRSTDAGGMYVDCANECLTQFAKRLELVTGKTEAQASALLEVARASKSEREFIRQIQIKDGLLDEIYKWEHSTPTNAKRFKDVGWFGIAAAFWNESGVVA